MSRWRRMTAAAAVVFSALLIATVAQLFFQAKMCGSDPRAPNALLRQWESLLRDNSKGAPSSPRDSPAPAAQHHNHQAPVPLRVHQTYISFAKLEETPSLRHWLAASGRWRTREPRLRYTFHSDADLRRLVADHYPWFLPTYDAYPRSIQRVDAARYFLLHRYGGLYADLDIEPSRMKRAIDGVLGDARPGQALLSPALGAGVSNDLMAAPPAHPLFLGAILHLHCHSAPPPLLPPMFSVLWSAGSLFLTAAVHRLPEPVAARDVVTDGRLYAYVRHLEGNSWHTPDAALLLGLFSLSYQAWLSMAAVAAAAGLWHCGPRRWRQSLWRRLAVLGFDVDRRP